MAETDKILAKTWKMLGVSYEWTNTASFLCRGKWCRAPKTNKIHGYHKQNARDNLPTLNKNWRFEPATFGRNGQKLNTNLKNVRCFLRMDQNGIFSLNSDHHLKNSWSGAFLMAVLEFWSSSEEFLIMGIPDGCWKRNFRSFLSKRA